MVGATMSTVIDSAPEAVPVPDAFVAVAVMLCGPLAKAVMTATVYAPPVAVPPPTCVPSEKIFTVLPTSAVPVNVGVVVLVMLSVLLAPVSLASVMSGVLGGAGVEA